MTVVVVVAAEYLPGVKTLGDPVGKKICACFAGRVAALVQKKVSEDRYCNADSIGLPGRTFEKEEEKSQEFVGVQRKI